MKTFKSGQWVRFKPEFQELGDDEIGFRCCEDESSGRVLIMACLGWPVNPTQIVMTEWLESDERGDA